MSALPKLLESTLAEVGRTGARLSDDWWVIGSAALALIGVDVCVKDVDVLASRRDALLFSADYVPQRKIEGSDRFRSVYRRYSNTLIPIEVMGDLEVRVADEWQRVRPTSRVEMLVGGERVFVPGAAEQLRLLRLFGREKDLIRAAALEELCKLT